MADWGPFPFSLGGLFLLITLLGAIWGVVNLVSKVRTIGGLAGYRFSYAFRQGLHAGYAALPDVKEAANPMKDYQSRGYWEKGYARGVALRRNGRNSL
ncbi:hypothetical protein ACFVWR_15915 [Leifsonia sp. NPDC058292]|uniref:hypothetical protein n=1 Tax=Leifsonia sp. NPDC058292 TaxID=3346428 RepID=UPI0036DBE125